MGKLLNNNLFLKVASIVILVLFAVALFKAMELNREYEDLKVQQKEIIDRIKKANKERLESNKSKQDSIVNSLRSEISELKGKKDIIVKETKDYETNPVYDIDFYDAFRVISDSDYERREGNGNPR